MKSFKPNTIANSFMLKPLNYFTEEKNFVILEILECLEPIPMEKLFQT